MTRLRQKTLYRILGVFFIVAGLALWYTSYVKAIYGGVKLGEYVPGFSVYNGSLHVWADFVDDSETHFYVGDLSFWRDGTDGTNSFQLIGDFGCIWKTDRYLMNIDIPFWLVSVVGLSFLLLSFWKPKRTRDVKIA